MADSASPPTHLSLGAWRDYLALCKLKVVALIVFTAFVGMLLATDQVFPPWRPALLGLIGIGLAAMSAAAINHLVEDRKSVV